jgi:ferredoxin-NADP reductase
MMSMLSYIDDLKLMNPVTLLYCVRTHEDIIFQSELVQLGKSLPNFKYEVSCRGRALPGVVTAGALLRNLSRST